MKQLFEVDEEVILCTKGELHLNGDAVVISVVFDGDEFIHPRTGVKLLAKFSVNEPSYFFRCF